MKKILKKWENVQVHSMILEEMGAQNLQKHGDLIFKSGGTDKIRAQGYFISTDKVDEIIESIKKQN